MSGSLLVDTGTYYTASGFAGDDIPSCVFPSLGLEIEESQQCFIGDEAIKQSLNYTNQTAKPTFNLSRNLYGYQELLKFSIEAAKPDASISDAIEFPVLLVEPLFSPKSTKEELTKFVFEELNLPGFYITNAPICSLYATARTSGMLMESSHAGISVTAAYEGSIQSYTSSKSECGGRLLSNLLAGCCLHRKSNLEQPVDLLTFLRQYSYNDENDQFQLNLQKAQASTRDVSDSDLVDPITAIKHKMFVSNSDIFCQSRFEKTLSQTQKKAKEQLKLPDGNSIPVDDELWVLPEVLFAPEFFNFKFPGLGHLVEDCCYKLDPFMSADVMKEIVVSGGLLEIQGFERRLQRELSNSLRESSTPKLVLSPTIPSSRTTRKGKSLAAWIGASILSSVSTFQQIWVMKSDYEESGPAVVHRKMLM